MTGKPSHCAVRWVGALRGAARGVWVAALLSALSAAAANMALAGYEIDVVKAGGAGPDDLASLNAALEKARAHRRASPHDTIVIKLPRNLALRQPWVLGSADSGAPSAPLILRGHAGEGTTITGGVTLNDRPLGHDLEGAENRFPADARDRIRVVDLADFASQLRPGIAAQSSFDGSQGGKLNVFLGGTRLVPSRWPADRYISNPSYVASPDPTVVTVRLPRGAPDGLVEETDSWINGNWAWTWWYEVSRLQAAAGSTIQFPMPKSGVKGTGRYYLSNVAGALERPGTFYVDAREDRLYYISRQAGDDKLSVAIADTAIAIEGASDIRIENIAVDKTIGTPIVIRNSTRIVIRDCFAGRSGGYGIAIDDGSSNVVDRCVVTDTGEGGVFLRGGDRKTLAPGNHVLRQSVITGFGRKVPTYRPGVKLEGVGNSVEDCEISDAPHSAIIFSGNEHRIVGNVIHDVVKDTGDAGAIYTARNWTARGNVISFNYLWNIASKVGQSHAVGIYLDDQTSGTTVTGNVVAGVDLPIQVGGGRDNRVSRNILRPGGKYAVVADARGLLWQKEMVLGLLRQGLEAVPYDRPPWSTRYPELARVLDDQPGAPLDNVVSDNVAFASELIHFSDAVAKRYINQSGNVTAGAPAQTWGLPAPDVLPDGAAKQMYLTETRDRLLKAQSNAVELRRRWNMLP